MANPLLFNRSLYRARRNRIAPNYPNHDFLKREACKRIADRLRDISRDFPLVLDLGCHTGQMQEELKDAGGIHRLIQCDSAEAMVRSASGERLACDEEALPFAENTFDAVLTSLSLHHINDLVGSLIQIQKILKPDGLLIAVAPGPSTLTELRESLTVADIATSGGLSPYISPFMDVRDAGNLLQRAGFALPVIDNETLTITYPDPHALMMELRGMGETNCLIEQRKGLTQPEKLASTCLHYMSEYGYEDILENTERGQESEPFRSEQSERAEAKPIGVAEVNANMRIRATVEFVTLTAWKPDASQQKPAKRGSGQVNLGEYFD